MITVTVDAEELYSVQRTLNATNHQVASAGLRSVNKTLSWIQAHGRRAIAAENDVPLKTLRRRVFVRKASGSALRGSVWFGTAPIKAIYAGSPIKSIGGIKVRGHFFQGSFVARMPAGHLGIFKRRGATRLHIDEQRINLSASAGVLGKIAAQAPERLRTIYAQELNYELNVRGF